METKIPKINDVTLTNKRDIYEKKNQGDLDKDKQKQVDDEIKKPIGVLYDKVTIEQLKEANDKAYQNLRTIVEEMLRKQGMTFKDIDIESDESIPIDDDTREAAQLSIKEGGEYSPENVSDRIVKFAKAISGGDKSKMNLLRDAIDEGFKEAEKAFGKLPEISSKTRELINQKLDEWENE